MKTVLVTGGAGAIGINLVNGLLDKAEKIIVVDDLSSGHSEFLTRNKKIEFIKDSITDGELYEKLSKQPIQIIFHLAAHFANQNSVEHPRRDLKVNGLGTLKLLEFAVKNKIEKFVYISSSCVYGNNHDAAEEDLSKIQLDTPYAITKYLGEHYTSFFHEYHKLNTVILRVFNSFGPGELGGKYRNVIPNFIDNAIKGKPLTITGTGNETRDFNWVGNVVQACILAATKEKANGQMFNIGSGVETKIIDIAKTIQRLSKNKTRIIFKPRRDWDKVLRRKANIKQAQKLLDYKPEINLQKHFKITYDWYVKHK